MDERIIRRAVVTGPTGAVGQALLRYLCAQGIDAYAVVRPESPRAATIPRHEKIHIVQCDAAELARLPALLPDGADAFFHLAWAHTIGSGRNDMPSQILNISHTIAACRAAAALGCKVFVGAGSQAEYGRVEGVLHPDTPCFPENGYGMAKLCAGQMSRAECASLGVDHIWMRILSVYGPNDGKLTMIRSVADQLLDGKCPALTPGEQQWDYLYADDAAEGLYLAARRGKSGAVYPLGSGEAKPLRRYVEALRDAIDPALPLGFGQVPYGEKQVMHLEADIRPLQNDTGFAPRVSFAEGIEKTVSAIKREREN